MTKQTKALIIGLIAIITITTTALVANGSAPIEQNRANGSSVMETITVRGSGNTVYDLGRVKPGVYRLSIALGIDSRLGKVTLLDEFGNPCAQTPPPVVMAFVSKAAGGVCNGGNMFLKIGNASVDKQIRLNCSGNDRENPVCQTEDNYRRINYIHTYQEHKDWFVLMERVARAK